MKIFSIFRSVFVVMCLIGIFSTVQAQTCTYNASSFTMTMSGTEPVSTDPTVTYLTRYILVDKTTNAIAQIASTPSFSGFVQTKTYDVYAFSYVNDNTVTGLSVGSPFSSVTASCFDLSNAQTVTVCPPTGGSTCDYTSSTFTVRAATTPPTTGDNGQTITTRYIYTDSNGIIQQVSNTPTFTGVATGSYNVYAVSYTGSIVGLTAGSAFNSIAPGTGVNDCMDLSSPLPVQVCACPTICLPVTVTKVK